MPVSVPVTFPFKIGTRVLTQPSKIFNDQLIIIKNLFFSFFRKTPFNCVNKSKGLVGGLKCFIIFT